MLKKLGWIRIACVCILILGLLGCAGNCGGKDAPAETVPETVAPETDDGTDTITEDSVIPANTDSNTVVQPTVPSESGEPANPSETEEAAATEAPATPDPLEIDPDDYDTTPTAGTDGSTPTPTPKPTATPKPGETVSPKPTADNSPIELPELP